MKQSTVNLFAFSVAIVCLLGIMEMHRSRLKKLEKRPAFSATDSIQYTVRVAAELEERLDDRLKKLEIEMWGPTRAPAVVDSDEEITGNDYDNVEVRVALQPALAVLVRDLFADGRLTNEEDEQITKAFRAIERKDRVERDIDEAKADLQKTLDDKKGPA